MRKFITVLTLLLSGCASSLPYIPPTTGPTSKISFVSNSSGAATNLAYFEDGLTCKGIHRVALFKTDYEGSSYVVRAGKPFTFVLSYAKGTAYCNQSFMFTPGEHEYRVRSILREKDCVMAIEKQVATSDGSQSWSPVDDIVKREPRTPFLEDGEWCEPLAAAQR